MISTGTKKDGKTKTGTFKIRTKNKHATTEKLELMYYDPRAWNEKLGKFGKHVKFKEGKVKK